MKKVTIIIPNYNGAHFMEACLASLKRQTSQDFDILVVDNGSTDGTKSLMEEKYPAIPVLYLKENTGFSGAVNAGIKRAKTPYVILLNNDTEAEDGYVEALVRAIERSPKIFSVSSLMIQMHDKEKIDDAGDLYNLLGWAAQRGVGRRVEKYDKPCQVFTACAGAAIYRREVFEAIGYFDQQHFAYLEDTDIGYRARIYGYENWYEPQARVCHVGSGTSGSRYNAFKVKLAGRNSVYLNYKNMPLLQLVINAVPLGIGYFLKFLFFKKIGFGDEYKGAVKEGIATRKQCSKVPFRFSHIGSYIRIEWELIANTFVYVWEFIARRAR